MNIERIQDVDTLRKVAVLLDRHVRTLNTYVRELKAENARLKGQDATAVQREMEALKELLAQRERMIFAEKTEQRPRTGTESASSEPAPRRGHGPRVQPTLPILGKCSPVPVATIFFGTGPFVNGIVDFFSVRLYKSHSSQPAALVGGKDTRAAVPPGLRSDER